MSVNINEIFSQLENFNELSIKELELIIDRIEYASKELHLLWSTVLDDMLMIAIDKNSLKSFEKKGEVFTLLDKNIKKLNDIKYRCIKTLALKQKRINDEISDQKSNERKKPNTSVSDQVF